MGGQRMRRRLERLASRFLARRNLDIGSCKSVVSFTFDDVPRSACRVGSRLIEAASGTATFYACGKLAPDDNDFFSDQDLQDLAARGHEIGSHGFHHVNYQTCTRAMASEDIALNDRYFESIGLPPADTFAYPYGAVRPSVKRLLSKRFSTMRGVQCAANGRNVDLSLLKSVQLYSSTLDMDKIAVLLQRAAARPTWLIFLSHSVTDDGGEFDIKVGDLEAVIRRVQESGLPMMSVGAALNYFRQGA